MTKDEAEQIARLLQQFHAVFGFVAVALLPVNRGKTVEQILQEVPQAERYGGAAFGFAALSFVQTYDCVYKELGKPAAMTAVVDRARLGVTVNDKAGGESEDEACLRHLRNSFAHGRFKIVVTGTTTTIEMDDQYHGKTTFTAKCDATVVLGIAEKLLIEAHKAASAVV